MKISTKLTSAIIGILLPVAAYSQALDLNSAVDKALQSSPTLQKTKSSADEASWKSVEAFSTYWPTLSANLNYLVEKKYVITDLVFDGAPASVPNIIPTTTATIQAQYLLFDGFASTNRYEGAKSMETAANTEYDWARFQTEKQTSLQFYRALSSKALEEVAEQNIKTLEDHLNDAHLLKKAGISTNYDVLRVEVQVSEAKSELINSQDNIEVSKGRLAEIIGQDTTQDVTGELLQPKPELISAMNENSIDSRPDLVAAQNRSVGLDHLATASQRHWVPQVALFGQYQYYNNHTDSADDWAQFRNAYNAGVSLTWNFFDGFASTAKAHEATEQRRQADKNLIVQRLKAKQDFNFWKRKYLYFCNVYRSRLSDIEKSKEAVRLAKEGRRVGARTNTDLLDAEVDLYRAQAGAVNAQMGSIEALINLELTTGHKVF